MAAITSAQELLDAYAQNTAAGNPRQVGSNVLMVPLFDSDGNVTREGKRISVTVEEPVGKYELFVRSVYGKNGYTTLRQSEFLRGYAPRTPQPQTRNRIIKHVREMTD